MQVQVITCGKCSHQWIARVSAPLRCPRCGHFIGASIRNKKAAEPQPGKPDSATLGQTHHKEGKPING